MESNGDKLLERIEKEYQTRLRCTFIQEEKEKIKAEYAFLIEQINNSTKFKNERIELLQKLADYAIPTIISDEVSIILRESRNLDAQIQNLPEYISQQKKHLLTSTMRHPFPVRVYARLDFQVFNLGLGYPVCRKAA